MSWKRAFLGYSTRGDRLPQAGETVRLLLVVRNDAGEWVRASSEGRRCGHQGWVSDARFRAEAVRVIAWSPLRGFRDAPLIVAAHEAEAHPRIAA